MTAAHVPGGGVLVPPARPFPGSLVSGEGYLSSRLPLPAGLIPGEVGRTARRPIFPGSFSRGVSPSRFAATAVGRPGNDVESAGPGRAGPGRADTVPRRYPDAVAASAGTLVPAEPTTPVHLPPVHGRDRQRGPRAAGAGQPRVLRCPWLAEIAPNGADAPLTAADAGRRGVGAHNRDVERTDLAGLSMHGRVSALGAWVQRAPFTPAGALHQPDLTPGPRRPHPT